MGGLRESEPWVVFLEGDVIGKQNTDGAVVYEMSIKVRPGGLLAVIKLAGQDGKLVGFVGAGGFQSLARKVRDALKNPRTAWRADRFARG